MKFAKPALMVVGCVLLTGLTLTLFAPKTVHALAAALVQITNTRSNPVPTQDVDIAARHPFTATCYVYGSSGAFVACQPTPAPPTTGYETVIQSVSISLNQDSGTVQPFVTEFNYNTGGASYQFFVPMLTQAQGAQGGEWVGSQPTAIYVDPNAFNPLQCATLFNGSGATATLTCTVSGYTVSLP
ncbi:MAG: hypothetical protein WCA89_06095 [Terracidiphilus sp.]|jgi:hypothetical protein